MPETIHQVDTPALIVDLDRLEDNISSLGTLVHTRDVSLWPHIKSHKSPEIAKMQLAAGADGITCQKISEAAIMAAGGCEPILIATPVVGAVKIARFIELVRQVEVTTVVDSLKTCMELGRALASHRMEVSTLVELDIGFHRGGVQPDRVVEVVAPLARGEIPGLRYAGVMAYEGHVYDGGDAVSAEQSAVSAYTRLGAALGRLARQGIAAPRVSVGATAAARVAIQDERINELRCGSYVFNDLTQLRAGSASVDRCALTVLATTVSVPTEDRAILDAGAKALTFATASGQEGYGLIISHETSTIDRLSDEHAIVHMRPPFLHLGERVRIIPNSHTTVVNEFDCMFGLRGEKVECVWTVAARGCSQ